MEFDDIELLDESLKTTAKLRIALFEFASASNKLKNAIEMLESVWPGKYWDDKGRSCTDISKSEYESRDLITESIGVVCSV